MAMAVEKCFCIVERHLADLPCLMQPAGEVSLMEERSEVGSIVRFVMTVLHAAARTDYSPLEAMYLAMGRHLMQKAIFSTLSRMIQRCMAIGHQSVHGTLLEQILTMTVDLLTNVTTGSWKSASGAFQLLAFPSLPSFCPLLVARAQPLLLHALPFIEEVLSKDDLSDFLRRTDMTVDHFRQSCLNALPNLIYLLSESLSLSSGNDPAQVRNLGLWMSRFMSWVIRQNLFCVPHDEDEMDTDEWLTTPHTLTPFRPCVLLQETVAKLHDHHGHLLVRSLTDALFSGGECDGQAVSPFCELLHFMICTATDASQLHGMLLSFAFSAKLIERLWHQCIQRAWNVSIVTFPDHFLVDNLLAPLSVLCQVYSAFLSTASKEDINQHQIPLRLLEIYDPDHPGNGLIAVLKKCMWHVGWVRSPAPSPACSHALHSAMMAQFPKICGRLLMQLHDNLTRWDLAPSEHFQIQSAQLTQFVKEASSQPIHHDDDESTTAVINRTSVVLTHASCLIPFQDRARIFQSYIDTDKKLQQTSSTGFSARPVHAHIRRLHLLEDGFEELGHLKGEKLRSRLRIEFVDEHGMVEAGVDGGGLFKDFIEELTKKGFDSEYGFFAVTEQQELYPNPSSIVLQPRALEIISFLGRMLGKAVYDGILLELPFAHFFLKKFRGHLCDLHDMPSLDLDVYNNLMQLRQQKDNLENLGLHFSITDNVFGQNAEIELQPNGKNIAVTQHNVLSYIHRFADYRLNKEVSATAKAFLHGFFDVIHREWVQMFSAMELRMLISGSSQRLDISNMRQYAHYAGGYHEEHPVILSFWEILENLTAEEQRHFLKFVTGCSRAPLLGFEQLQPRMSIQMAGNVLSDHATGRLPTSATCVNLLKLPPYASKEVMKQKLLYAISSKTGFHLS